MNIILQAIPKGGRLAFYNHYDLERFCNANEGEEMLVEIKPIAKTSPKMRMYAYYHKVVLTQAVLGFTNAGYSGIDKVCADYKLKANFAKDYIVNVNTGEEEPYLLDKSKMDKDRLYRYISDCIFFIESELQIEVPDSQQYKLMKETGKKFISVKNLK